MPKYDVKCEKMVRKCEICHSTQSFPIHTQSFVLPEGSRLPSSYNIVECGSCGFVYADTSSCQADYDYHYAYSSKYEEERPLTTFDEARVLKQVETLISLVNKNHPSILDIGCGSGHLLKKLKRQFSNVTGLDPSKKCCEIMESNGIKTINASLFSAPSGKFDVIILSHVLEHIRDLDRAMANIASASKHDSIVYVEVPDASRYQDYYNGPNYYFDCEHINHFDQRSLNDLFSNIGMTPVYCKQEALMVSSSSRYPILASAYKKGRSASDSVARYSDISKPLDDVFDRFVESREPIVIWGAGQMTMRTLATTNLSTCNAVAIIDNDKSKHGRCINGIQVYGPDYLTDKSHPVIVLSSLFSEDITRQLEAIGYRGEICTKF